MEIAFFFRCRFVEGVVGADAGLRVIWVVLGVVVYVEKVGVGFEWDRGVERLVANGGAVEADGVMAPGERAVAEDYGHQVARQAE